LRVGGIYFEPERQFVEIHQSRSGLPATANLYQRVAVTLKSLGVVGEISCGKKGGGRNRATTVRQRVLKTGSFSDTKKLGKGRKSLKSELPF